MSIISKEPDTDFSYDMDEYVKALEHDIALFKLKNIELHKNLTLAMQGLKMVSNDAANGEHYDINRIDEIIMQIENYPKNTVNYKKFEWEFSDIFCKECEGKGVIVQLNYDTTTSKEICKKCKGTGKGSN